MGSEAISCLPNTSQDCFVEFPHFVRDKPRNDTLCVDILSRLRVLFYLPRRYIFVVAPTCRSIIAQCCETCVILTLNPSLTVILTLHEVKGKNLKPLRAGSVKGKNLKGDRFFGRCAPSE